MTHTLLTHCTACPRRCGVDRTSTVGYCGADDKIKLGRYALHYWEEPPISGTCGSGAVFFSHCNLRCVFCQNHEISTLHHGKYYTEDALVDILLTLQSQGAHNINLVTPTHYIPRLCRVLPKAKARGLHIPVVYNCGGYENADALRLLRGLIDIYLPDVKYFDDLYARTYSHAPDYFAYCSTALSEMFAQVGKPVFSPNGILQKGLLARHMLLPGLLFDSKKIIDYLFRTFGHDIYISIMCQYTPMPSSALYPALSRPVPKGHYETLVEYARRIGIENAYIQSAESVGAAFIPAFYTDI